MSPMLGLPAWLLKCCVIIYLVIDGGGVCHDMNNATTQVALGHSPCQVAWSTYALCIDSTALNLVLHNTEV
jgi:hypothetical protein